MTVSANPVLDFDVLRSEEKSYSDPNPDGGGFAVIDEQLTESLVNGSTGDIPGTDTNPAAGPGYVTGDGAGSTYDKDHSNQEKVYNQKDTVSERHWASWWLISPPCPSPCGMENGWPRPTC